MTSAPKQSLAPLFTLTEVLGWKRQALHNGHDGQRGHIYDGSIIWGDGNGALSPVRPTDAPQDGWRHRGGCTCPVCASHRRPSGPDVDHGVAVSATRELTERLVFGSQAAAIQIELSQLIVDVTGLFQSIQSTGDWPTEEGQGSRSWAERGVALVERWTRLEPPPALASVWEELCAHFDVLVGLLQAVPELGDQSDGHLRASVAELQAAINQQLHTAIAWEAKLHEEQGRLRLSARRVTR